MGPIEDGDLVEGYPSSSRSSSDPLGDEFRLLDDVP